MCEKRLRPMPNVSQLIKAPADSLIAAGAPTSHSVSLGLRRGVTAAKEKQHGINIHMHMSANVENQMR